MTVQSTSAAGAVTSLDFKNMDIETALMYVQSNRAQQAEASLRSQMEAVQANNDKIAKLNTALGVMSKAAAAFQSDATATTRIDDGKKGDRNFSKDNHALEREANTAFIDAGITSPELSKSYKDEGGLTNTKDSEGKEVRLKGGLRGDVTKGQVEGMVQQLKSKIDSLSNSQQMDMLRLQSLTNKRNEAYDIMTNFMKKSQDSKGSIIGNMR